MSNHTNAEAAAHDLNGVSFDEPGRVGVIGFQAVTFALLDIADAIREQTAEISGGLEELKKSVDYGAEHRRG